MHTLLQLFLALYEVQRNETKTLCATPTNIASKVLCHNALLPGHPDEASPALNHDGTDHN